MNIIGKQKLVPHNSTTVVVRFAAVMRARINMMHVMSFNQELSIEDSTYRAFHEKKTKSNR